VRGFVALNEPPREGIARTMNVVEHSLIEALRVGGGVLLGLLVFYMGVRLFYAARAKSTNQFGKKE
jgi:hypothetical protein